MVDRKWCSKHMRYYLSQCPECADEISKIDINDLTEKAKQKRDQKRKDAETTQEWIDEITGIKYEGVFEVCPDCGQRTLLYNKTRDKKQCNNPKCHTNFKNLSDRINNDFSW